MNGRSGMLRYYIHVTLADRSIADRQREVSKERYDTLPTCLWSSLTFLPKSERTSEMWLDTVNCLTCALQVRAGLWFFLILLNIPAVAALGLRGYSPADSLS